MINFLFMVAEEMRGIMAELGFKTVKEMVGRAGEGGGAVCVGGGRGALCVKPGGWGQGGKRR